MKRAITAFQQWDEGGKQARPEIARLIGALQSVAGIVERCELAAPTVAPAAGGGRHGRHSSYLGYLLAEMQVLARQHPGASW